MVIVPLRSYAVLTQSSSRPPDRGRNRNADLSLAKRRRVIGAIAGHSGRMPAFLEGLDEIIRAFRQNAREYREILRVDTVREVFPGG